MLRASSRLQLAARSAGGCSTPQANAAPAASAAHSSTSDFTQVEIRVMVSFRAARLPMGQVKKF